MANETTEQSALVMQNERLAAALLEIRKLSTRADNQLLGEYAAADPRVRNLILREALVGVHEEASDALKTLRRVDLPLPTDADARKATCCHVKHPNGSAIKMTKLGRTLVGVIEEVCEHVIDPSYPYAYGATVYDEGWRVVFTLDACSRGLDFQRSVLKAAMREALMKMTHNRRHRLRARRAAAGRAGSPLPAAETAAAEPTSEELENA